MPGNVQNAAATLVLPAGLCSAYSQSREWACDSNQYRSAEWQVRSRTATSRRTWRQSRRLTAAALVTLRNFYDSVGGPWKPFYFYDLQDQPGGTYDATGVATTSRYTVRFEGEWGQTMSLARGEAGLVLVEIT